MDLQGGCSNWTENKSFIYSSWHVEIDEDNQGRPAPCASVERRLVIDHLGCLRPVNMNRTWGQRVVRSSPGLPLQTEVGASLGGPVIDHDAQIAGWIRRLDVWQASNFCHDQTTEVISQSIYVQKTVQSRWFSSSNRRWKILSYTSSVPKYKFL